MTPSTPTQEHNVGEMSPPPKAGPSHHRRLVAILVLAIASVAITLLYAGAPPPPHTTPTGTGQPVPTVGEIVTSPSVIAVNTPTTVTVTARVDAPTVNPANVDLLRVDASGRLVANLGAMNDDGHEGDAKPGDRVFTWRGLLSPSSTAEIRLQVSAAFRGIFRRVLSSPKCVAVWNVFDGQHVPLSVLIPPRLSIAERTLDSGGTALFVFDPKAPDDGGSFEVQVFDVPTAVVSIDELTRFRFGEDVQLLNIQPLWSGALAEGDSLTRWHYFQRLSDGSGLEVSGAVDEAFFRSLDFSRFIGSIKKHRP